MTSFCLARVKQTLSRLQSFRRSPTCALIHQLLLLACVVVVPAYLLLCIRSDERHKDTVFVSALGLIGGKDFDVLMILEAFREQLDLLFV